MKKIFNIGIMGCGQIAIKMVEAIMELQQSEEALYDYHVCAVASRSEQKAKLFAKEHVTGKDKKTVAAFGSYEELAAMDDIDLIYVATPNHAHFENTMLCIKSGKNVLVEKPFMMSKDQAHQIFVEATNRRVFVCEAMWTSFMKLHAKMLEWIDSGKIGDVKYISSNLGYEIAHRERLTSLAMGGGAYLDLGVYTTHLALSVLGDDLIVSDVFCKKTSTGVDRITDYRLEQLDKGAYSTSYVVMDAKTDRSGHIIGTKGRIDIQNINCYERIDLFDHDYQLVESVVAEGLGGYAQELQGCANAIINGRIQANEMPWSRTMALATINDEILRRMNR